MRTEKEIKDKLNYVKDNIIELISNDRNLSNVNLAKLKLIINALRWVLGEKELILNQIGGTKI